VEICTRHEKFSSFQQILRKTVDGSCARFLRNLWDAFEQIFAVLGLNLRYDLTIQPI